MEKDIIIRKSLTPDVWGMLTSVAASMFDGRSQLGIIKRGEAEIKLLFCYENDLALTSAVTGLYVVNGRLAVMSNIIASRFRQHPHYDYKITEHNNKGCVIDILRHGEVIGTSSFVEEDAILADLLKKSVWEEYPRNMYFGRAMTNGCRWHAPDLFQQPIYIPEELGMAVDGEGAPIIDAVFEVVDEKEIVISLNSLALEYGADEILKANEGVMPASQDDINRIAEILEGESNDE